MKCYNHHYADALGTCKHCQKGICMECIADTGNGLACNTGCETHVRGINAVVDRQINMYGATGSSFKQRILFYIAFAVFFILMGVQVRNNLTLEIVFIAMGCLFILMSFSSYRQQKK